MKCHDDSALYYASLGVRYIGQLKRLIGQGQYPLDMFNDLSTGTTFTRMPFESLDQAIERARAAFRDDYSLINNHLVALY